MFSIFLSGPLPSVPLEQILPSLSPSSPLLHHLSLQSLARLTATSSSVRSSIFSLSQPGGHPHNWNTVSQSCLATLDSISSSITSLTSPKPIAPAAPVPKPQPQQISSPNMRRLAPSFGAKMEEVPVPATLSPAKQMISSISSVLERVKKQPGVAWLFRVHPDAGIRHIFCKSQAAIWSVDILSYLIANSINEDKFGVVQKELAIILNSLLSLDQKMSVYRKVGGAFEKDVKLRHELKAAVKSGLYRIAIQYGEHIQAIPLDREHSNKMMSYQKLMEA
jgi:nucleoporin NDC1